MSARPGLSTLPAVQETLLKRSVEPHVASFDFMLGEGLKKAIANLDPVQIDLPDGKGVSIWIESADVGYPCNKMADDALMPRDCRLAGTTYSAPFHVRVGWEPVTTTTFTDDKGVKTAKVSRGGMKVMQRQMGRLPIMIRSSKCNLTRHLDTIPKPVMTDANGVPIDAKTRPNEAFVPSSHEKQQEYAAKVRTYLTSQGEEETEQGGYFIINGNEKVCRMLAVQRRNYPLAQTRSHYAQSGPNFSTHLCHIRCVRDDESSHSNALHFLHNGDCTVRFLWKRQNYFLPAVLLLRAWKSTTDREIYQLIVQGDNDNTFVTDRVEGMLRAWRMSEMGSQANTREECTSHIGALFRTSVDLPAHVSDYEVGVYMLNQVMFIHLDNDEAKFNLMIYMIRKVYGLGSGEAMSENADSPSTQEVLLPGHLYLQILKEKLQEWLGAVKGNILKEVRAGRKPVDVHNEIHLRASMDRAGDVGRRIEMFLATGNLVSPSGLDVRQTSGFCIVADRLNYLRFMAHFRGIHRGQFFTTLRTTDVRKLQPDNWGFLCPVHTPDGAPCGLLNHMAAPATVSTGYAENRAARQAAVTKALSLFGLVSPASFSLTSDYLSVLLDGQLIGYVKLDKADEMVLALRALKVQNGMMDPMSDVRRWMDATVGPFDVKTLDHINEFLPPFPTDPSQRVPWDMEAILIKPGGKQYPALFLFTSPARLRRPVFNLNFAMVESIGTFEQPYLYIECPSQNRRVQERMAKEMLMQADAGMSGAHGDHSGHDHHHGHDHQHQQEETQGQSTTSLLPTDSAFSHREIDPSNIFSEIGLMTPFSEFNQSPRNMYQCQMCKQTMGTPIHAYQPRADNKLYRILNPQTPLVRSIQQDLMDGYPHGANAVVAVISYTGYDMEDAMIINKSAYERGWGTGYVYKADTVDVSEEGSPSEGLLVYFNNYIEGDASAGEGEMRGLAVNAAVQQSSGPRLFEPTLDWDGLPRPGQQLAKGDPWYVTYDEKTKKHTVHRYKLNETATVEDIIVVGVGRSNVDGLRALQKVVFKLRYRRMPTRGDKFASRAGQKGVLAQLWPHIDMPFAESGITPDVIINPNAFPSRMTIGMLIESMAGKSGALHGMRQDCTAFGYSEKNTASTYFGKQLLQAGYNYYGNEMMYSGLTGEAFQADVYMGVVYYQRLRHMVGDKYQVRSTGQRNALTRQPVKGRKKGGGIRFGEMERDSLLAHGVAHMLHDRLFNSSDRSRCYACKTCGSVIAPVQMSSHTKLSSVSAAAASTATTAAAAEFQAQHASHGASKFLAQNTLADSLGVSATNSSTQYCTLCQSSAGIVTVEIPFVFRYLLAELSAMNVRISLDIE